MGRNLSTGKPNKQNVYTQGKKSYIEFRRMRNQQDWIGVFSRHIKMYYREKVLYHRVFELFPLTYMCVDIDVRLFSDQKS